MFLLVEIATSKVQRLGMSEMDDGQKAWLSRRSKHGDFVNAGCATAMTSLDDRTIEMREHAGACLGARQVPKRKRTGSGEQSDLAAKLWNEHLV